VIFYHQRLFGAILCLAQHPAPPSPCLQRNTLLSARMANECRKFFPASQFLRKADNKCFGVCVVNYSLFSSFQKEQSSWMPLRRRKKLQVISLVTNITVQPTKYVYIKSTTVYVPSSELGLSQLLSRQLVCPSPQNRGGAHSPAGDGLGESQF
jgi:hypothetical protein